MGDCLRLVTSDYLERYAEKDTYKRNNVTLDRYLQGIIYFYLVSIV